MILLRLARHAATLAACLAALPQLAIYANQVRSGEYVGSAYLPRVETMLQMSAAAAQGGPFAAVKEGRRFRLAGDMVPDLGVPALLDLQARATGTPATRRALGIINLLVLGGALLGLVSATPPPLRWALVPVFLLSSLSVPEYQSPDVVAIHGALGVLAIVATLVTVRAGPAWRAIPGGLLLFALHAVRSVYGLYGLATLLAVGAVLFVRSRDRRVALRVGIALLAFGVPQALWLGLLTARAADPRVADRDTITSHDVYAMLISGVGWSDNRWGIEASDPKVLIFIGKRLGLPELPRLDTREGERLAREAYLSLWREDAGQLLTLYLGRLPTALSQFVPLGLWGAVLWLPALAASLFWSWRRSEPALLGTTLGCALLAACLIGQVALIDPRIIYAYPLRFLSTLSFAVSCATLLRLRSAPEAASPAP